MPTTPVVQQLSPDVCVTGQLDPDGLAWAARSGFRSVINNRPDHEGGPEQPSNASLEAAAREHGLAYAFLPVASSMQTPEEIARFGKLIETLPKPILAFCRSGTRSGRLYRAATGS